MEHYTALPAELTSLLPAYTIIDALPVRKQNAYKASFLLENGSTGYCFVRRGDADRLRLQYQLLLALQTIVPVPQVIDFLEGEGSAYLITEWLEGTTPEEEVHRIFRHRSWVHLSGRSQTRVIAYIKEMTAIVCRLHAAGYVHGGIKPDKFIISNDKVYLASLTEASLANHTDMLAQKGDVYKLGLLIIRFLTDYAAHKFDLKRPDRLYNSLLYFINDVEIVKTIVACVDNDPEKRPAAEKVLTALDNFSLRIAPQQYIKGASFTAGILHQSNVEEMVRQSLLIPVNGQSPFADVTSGSWKEGLAGLYYVAGRCPWPNIAFRHVGAAPSVAVVTPGLYTGLAGVAMGLSATGNSGLEGWFEKTPLSATMADGAAGQGLAALHTIPVAGRGKARVLAAPYVQYLLEKQLPDGSWVLPAGSSSIGFSDGVAGIAFFLWLYHDYYSDERVRQSAVAAMQWLQQQLVMKEEQESDPITPWFTSGIAGIAFSFITAYRISGEAAYRQVAEKALLTVPDHFHSGHFNFAGGITGLGETYLEAWRVFQDPVWQLRAHHLADKLMHANRLFADGGCYWITGASSLPSAGLLNGNAGILHFLMRYVSGTAVPHLFLPL